MIDKRITRLFMGAAVALMSAAAARADDAPQGQGGQLEEVVITATRTETNLQKTAVAVTALSGEALRDHNVSSLLDVSNFVPSLSIGGRSGTSTAYGAVAIRGIGVDSFGSSAAVGIYVDDVYLPSGAGNLLGLFDVGRVEVLRGPQGTLFGRNTIAGAIQYVTNPADKSFGGYLDATGGSNGRADVQGAVNVPLADTLSIRLAAASTARDGYVSDLTSHTDRGADRTQEGRIKVRWTPTDRLTVDLKGEAVQERTNGRPVIIDQVNPNAQFAGLAFLFGEHTPLTDSLLSPGHYSSVGFNAPDAFRSQYTEQQAVVSYALTDKITLKSITASSLSKSSLQQDFDNTPLSILGGELTRNIKLFSQEVQLSQHDASSRLNWTLGAYYYDSQEVQAQAIGLGFAPYFVPNGNVYTDIKSSSVYGQAVFKLTDLLSVTGGLRYSSEENSSSLEGGEVVNKTFKDTSPLVGIDYKLSDDVMFYAKASKGFRAGGITPSAALPGGGLAFSPETAWTYELGARAEFLDRRFRINPTFFYTDWKNIQFNVLIPTPTTVVAATNNAGDAHIKGFELEAQFAATERLLLTGSMSLMDGQYKRVAPLTRAEFPYGFLATFPNPDTGDVMPGSTVILPNITLNSPLQRAPKSKFTGGARYSYPLDGGAKLVASIDYAWTAKQNSAVTIADAVVLPAYGVLNGRLQYDAANGKWSLAAFGTNLTDEYYLVGGVDFAKGYTAGTRELDVARPREMGVELRLRF